MAPSPIEFDSSIKEYPQVYNVPPLEPTEAKIGQMTKEQLNHFFSEGYVILENVIDTALLDGVKKDLEKQAITIRELPLRMFDFWVGRYVK